RRETNLIACIWKGFSVRCRTLRPHSKAAGTAWKNRRLCLSAPDEEHAKRGNFVGAVEPGRDMEKPRAERSDMFPGASPAFPGKQGRLGNALLLLAYLVIRIHRINAT